MSFTLEPDPTCTMDSAAQDPDLESDWSPRCLWGTTFLADLLVHICEAAPSAAAQTEASVQNEKPAALRKHVGNGRAAAEEPRPASSGPNGADGSRPCRFSSLLPTTSPFTANPRRGSCSSPCALLPCHALLLCQHSRVLRTSIQLHLSSTPPVPPPSAPPSLPCITMTIQPGQLPAAVLMLRAMYDPDCCLSLAQDYKAAAASTTDSPPDPLSQGTSRTHTYLQQYPARDNNLLHSWRRRLSPLRVSPPTHGQPAAPGTTPLLPRHRRVSEHGRGLEYGSAAPLPAWGSALTPQLGAGPGLQPGTSRSSTAAEPEPLLPAPSCQGSGSGRGLDAWSCSAAAAAAALCEAAASRAALPLLLDVIRLADQYQADTVMQAAAEACMLLLELWSWSDVVQVLDLPLAALTTSSALEPLLHAARDRLWQEFNDLEAAWGDVEKRSMWLKLPYCGVEWVLGKSGLKVRSENTVFVALSNWVERGAGSCVLPQQLSLLLDLVHTQHFTPAFFLAEVRPRPWFRSAINSRAGGGAGAAAADGTTGAVRGGTGATSAVEPRGQGQGQGQGLGVSGSGMEDLVAAYLLHSCGLDSLSKQALQPRGAFSCSRRRTPLPRFQTCAKAQLHVHISMQQLEQVLNPGTGARGGLGRVASELGGRGAETEGEEEGARRSELGGSSGSGSSSFLAAAAAAHSLLHPASVHAQVFAGQAGAAAAAAAGSGRASLASLLPQQPRLQELALELGAHVEGSGLEGGGARGLRRSYGTRLQGSAAGLSLPVLLVASEPLYCAGYYWVLEIFMTEDRKEDCLVACLHAITPAVGLVPTAAAGLGLCQGYQGAAAGGGCVQEHGALGSRSVVVTAHMQISVWDHELTEWGLLYRNTLPVRTGFGESGSVRYTEFYPIWNRSSLGKLSSPSAWQRLAYAPSGKISLKAEIIAVE